MTFRCNQKCSKCSHWKMKNVDYSLDISIIIENIKKISSLKDFCIVGGEPLIYKHKVLRLIEGIEGCNIRTTIVTNGLEMDENFINKISLYNIHLVISVDTMDRSFWKFVRGDDSYERVMSNLQYAISTLEPAKISIQSVLAKDTLEHIEKVKEFCKTNNIHHSVQKYIKEGFNGKWTPINQNNLVSLNGNKNEECFAAGKNLSIMPDGKVYTCFQQSQISGFSKPLGNIFNTSIDEMIRSAYSAQVLNSMRECNLPCKVLKCNQSNEDQSE